MDDQAAKKSSGDDGREEPRQRTYLGATIVIGADMLTIDCTIRDWSERGVKVELPATALLPSQFWLIDHRIRYAHEVRLVWRRGPFAGLEVVRRRGLDQTTDRNLGILRRIWLEKAPRSAMDSD